MRQAFVTASGIPYSNRDLLESSGYRDRDDLFLSCTGRRLSKTLFPAIWTITIPPDAPVVIGKTTLQAQIEADRRAKMQILRLKAGLPEVPDETDSAEKSFKVVPMMNRSEHREFYQAHRNAHAHSPHGFPFTLGVGGFLYVEQRGEEHHNDPRQFVLERNGQVNPGVWTSPSGLASGDPFNAMCREVTEEAGLVLLDDQQKTATIVVPDFVVQGSSYDFIRKTLSEFDGMPIKRAQTSNIRAALEQAGKGDYRMSFQKFETRLLTDKLPPRDKVEFSYPYEFGMKDQVFRAFVVKDSFGSINIHLPFMITLPENANLLTIDCERFGRRSALKTQDELLELHRHPDGSKVTAVMRDLLQRPFKLLHIPETAPPVMSSLNGTEIKLHQPS